LFDQNYEEAWLYSTMGKTFNFGIRKIYWCYAEIIKNFKKRNFSN
jgi:hypothetical protein